MICDDKEDYYEGFTDGRAAGLGEITAILDLSSDEDKPEDVIKLIYAHCKEM